MGNKGLGGEGGGGIWEIKVGEGKGGGGMWETKVVKEKVENVGN